MLGVGYWVLDAGSWVLLDAKCWILGIGYWVLDIGG